MNGTYDTFFVAPFAVDGELVGIGTWRVSDLSSKWLDICEQVLTSHGSVFRVSFGQTLDHIEVELTSAHGVGLGTFFVHGQIVLSTAYLQGKNKAVEQELRRMFIDSLRRTAVVRQSQTSAQPFEEIMKLAQRPLHVVVPWANPRVSDADHSLVTELATHFAATFLCRSPDQSRGESVEPVHK